MSLEVITPAWTQEPGGLHLLVLYLGTSMPIVTLGGAQPLVCCGVLRFHPRIRVGQPQIGMVNAGAGTPSHRSAARTLRMAHIAFWMAILESGLR